MAGILKVDTVQSDSNLAFNIAGSNVAYMNSTGLNITGGEIIAGGSTIRTTNGLIYANNGIKFPTTQVSSTDSNTLDDYEEGTFTAYLAGNTSGTPLFTAANPYALRYTTANARYIKIGRMVVAQGYITHALSFNYNTGFSGSTNVWIAGLPFAEIGNSDSAISNIGGVYSPVTIGWQYALTGWAAGYAPMGIIETGSTIIRHGYMNSNAFAQSTATVFYNAASEVIFNVTYFTS